MKILFIPIIVLSLISCKDTKSSNDLIKKVANTQEQRKSEIEIKRERLRSISNGKFAPIGLLLTQDSVPASKMNSWANYSSLIFGLHGVHLV